MGGIGKQCADSIGRPVVIFAVIIALCCLPGCGLIQGMLENLDDDEDVPPKWHSPDDDKDSLLSALQLYSPTGMFRAGTGIQPVCPEFTSPPIV